MINGSAYSVGRKMSCNSNFLAPKIEIMEILLQGHFINFSVEKAFKREIMEMLEISAIFWQKRCIPLFVPVSTKNKKY